MDLKIHRLAALTAAALFLSGGVLVTTAVAAPPKKGAKKPPVKKPPVKPKVDPAKMIAAGKKVYADNGCSACHAVGGEGGKTGPALDGIGKERDSKFIAKYIKNPKAVKADSTMPAYEETIKGKDMDNLVAYMSSLKGKK